MKLLIASLMAHTSAAPLILVDEFPKNCDNFNPDGLYNQGKYQQCSKFEECCEFSNINFSNKFKRCMTPQQTTLYQPWRGFGSYKGEYYTW